MIPMVQWFERADNPEDCRHFGFSVIMWPSRYFAGRNETYIYGAFGALNQLH